MMRAVLDSGQKIVTSGLVLNLDAAQKRSYPGSGTTWTDLSNNGNNGTLTNGPTFNSGNGGSIVLDGINDYVSISYSSSFAWGTNNFTLSLWIKIDSTTPSFFTRLIDQNYLNSFSFMLNSSKNLQFEINGNASSVIDNSKNYADDIWHNCVAIRTASTTASIYVDGVIKNSGNVVGGNITSTNNIAIGGEFNGSTRFLKCNVSTALIYNRALTATEVLQNYNAIKSRFGL